MDTSGKSLMSMLHTSNRPQNVFPRDLPKISNHTDNSTFTIFDLRSWLFMCTQRYNDCGFEFITIYIMHFH